MHALLHLPPRVTPTLCAVPASAPEPDTALDLLQTMSGQLDKSFNWDIIGAAGGTTNNLGYYNFSRNLLGMQMPDFRGYSSAAVMSVTPL